MIRSIQHFCLVIFLLFLPFKTYAVHTTTVRMPVFAQGNSDVASTNSATSPDAAAGEGVEYPLPYPGILTNHPLYFLKTMRDFLIERSLTDPTKKINFALLQSDKFFSMGMSYYGTKDYIHMLDVFIRASKEREKAILYKQQYDRDAVWVAPSALEKLNLSVAEHVELLERMLPTIPEEHGDSVRTELDTVKKQQKQLGS